MYITTTQTQHRISYIPPNNTCHISEPLEYLRYTLYNIKCASQLIIKLPPSAKVNKRWAFYLRGQLIIKLI